MRVAWLLSLFVVLGVACSSTEPSPTATPSATATPAPTATPELPDAAALFDEAFTNTSTRTTATLVQNNVANVAGSKLESTTEIAMVSPTKAYIRVSGNALAETELVIDGAEAHMRVLGGTWFEASLEDLGLDPGSLTDVVDIRPFASQLEVRGIETIDGVDVFHLRLHLDGNAAMAEFAQLFLEGSLQQDVLQQIDYRQAQIDYYIDVDERIIRRVEADIVYEFGGIVASGVTETSYDYESPITFPADAPIQP